MTTVQMHPEMKYTLEGYKFSNCWMATEFDHLGKPKPFKKDGKGGYSNAKFGRFGIRPKKVGHWHTGYKTVGFDIVEV